MLQPKVYIKKWNKVREVEMIDFYNKQVLAYVIGVRPRGEKAIYSFDEVEFIENTGFKDNNGKDIFVGDIIKQHKSCLRDRRKNFLVEKHDFDKRYTFFNLEEYYYDLDEDEAEFVEVIGNVYENEELLED